MDLEDNASYPPLSEVYYTVYARDTPFRLTRSQIEYDSPNYFTSAFLTHDFAESSSREIRTERNPQLFALIVEHLSGYTVLPLQSSALPSWMSVEAAKENLLRDARYFGLEQLQKLLVPPRTMPAALFNADNEPNAEPIEIYDFRRVFQPNGDLTLNPCTERWFKVRVDEIRSDLVWRLTDVPVLVTLQETYSEIEDGAVELEEIACLEVQLPRHPVHGKANDVSLKMTVQFLQDQDVITINGHTFSGVTLVHLLNSWKHEKPLPADIPADCFEHFSASDSSHWADSDAMANKEEPTMPALRVTAEELIFSLSVMRLDDPKKTLELEWNYRYSKLETIDQWKTKKWNTALAELGAPRY